MKRLVLFTVFIVLCTLMSSCSSPESDGKRAAEKLNDCQVEFIKDLNNAYNSYINDFASYSFRTRVDAREKLNSLIKEADKKLERCTEEAVTYKDKVESKYRTNIEKSREFQYAYNAQLQPSNANNATITSLQERVDRMIQTIIPPSPNLDKVKRDLVGRRISEGSDGYRKKGWYWTVKSIEELKDVEMIAETKNGDDYIYDMHLILQGENSDYDAIVRLYYVLRQYDDWTIEVIETQDMQIVQTHRYDNCISTRPWGMLGEHRYEFTNNCDVQLLVGGVVLLETHERWEKFSVLVDANSKTTVGDMLQNRIKDCKIHFIERP